MPNSTAGALLRLGQRELDSTRDTVIRTHTSLGPLVSYVKREVIALVSNRTRHERSGYRLRIFGPMENN